MTTLTGKTSGERGVAAEQVASRYLQQHGLHSVAQNVRGRFGELDLVMRDGPCLVFVEVRYRNSTYFGSAAASVDHRKQRKLIATAQGYLQQHPHNGPCRFDVVGISHGMNEIEWLQNAFELSE